MAKALNRFTKEDPTFRTHVDPESQPDDHPGHGRAPPRRLHRAHEARVQAPRSRRACPRSPTARPSPSAPSSTTPTRSRPAAPASTAASPAIIEPCDRGALRVRRTRSRAAASRASSSPPATRASRRSMREGRAHRLPRRRRPRRHQRRPVPRGRLLGHRLPAGRHRRLPRGLRQGQAPDPRADHEGLGRGPDRVPGQHLRLHQPAPRHHRQLGRGRGLLPASRPRCRSPRCSATPPVSAR